MKMEREREKMGKAEVNDTSEKGVLYSIYYTIIAILTIPKFNDSKIIISVLMIVSMLCLIVYLSLLILNDLYITIKRISFEKLYFEITGWDFNYLELSFWFGLKNMWFL